MAENLLNIGSFVSKTSEQANAPKKAYVGNVDSAFSFDKVFDSANKAYGADRTSFNAPNSNASSSYNETEKFAEKENFNKIDDKKSYDDSSKIREKDEYDESRKDEISNKSKDSEDSNESDDSENSSDKKEAGGNSTSGEDSKSAAQEQTTVSTAVDAIMGQAVALVASVETNANAGSETSNLTEQSVNTDAKAINPNEQVVKTTAADKNLDVDLNKMAQTTKDAVDSKSIKAKVQAEVQQLLLKITPEQSSAQAGSTAQAADADAKAQSPLIQASAEVAANVSKVAAPKKVLIREMLEKAVLTQEVLEKTNATVVGVEKSASSNNGNLLNQQNAKEQGVKMALNAVDNTHSANFAGQNSQVSFDKKIEAAQAPKEISKSEILSQIHTKMEPLKDSGTTKVTMILKPESLGKISLELINGKDGFTASMTAENAQVKELLDKNLDSLKSSLASQGVNVGNVTVKVAETEKQSNDMFAFDQRQSEMGENQSQTSSSGSGNQGDSNNSRSAKGYFEEDIVNMAEPIASEESSSMQPHEGKVDYKI